MENKPLFSVWQVYPLDSLPFFLIVAILLLLATLLFFGYRRFSKRLLMAIALLAALVYTMFIWNLSKNLLVPDGWAIFTAYLLYAATAQGLIFWGTKIKEPALAWGGWFFLILTLIHFIFVNVWSAPPQFKWMSALVLLFGLLYNRRFLPNLF